MSEELKAYTLKDILILVDTIDALHKQLEIAVEAMKKVRMETGNGFHMQVYSIVDNALAEIEMKNG